MGRVSVTSTAGRVLDMGLKFYKSQSRTMTFHRHLDICHQSEMDFGWGRPLCRVKTSSVHLFFRRNFYYNSVMIEYLYTYSIIGKINSIMTFRENIFQMCITHNSNYVATMTIFFYYFYLTVVDMSATVRSFICKHLFFMKLFCRFTNVYLDFAL